MELCSAPQEPNTVAHAPSTPPPPVSHPCSGPAPPHAAAATPRGRPVGGGGRPPQPAGGRPGSTVFKPPTCRWPFLPHSRKRQLTTLSSHVNIHDFLSQRKVCRQSTSTAKPATSHQGGSRGTVTPVDDRGPGPTGLRHTFQYKT